MRSYADLLGAYLADEIEADRFEVGVEEILRSVSFVLHYPHAATGAVITLTRNREAVDRQAVRANGTVTLTAPDEGSYVAHGAGLELHVDVARDDEYDRAEP